MLPDFIYWPFTAPVGIKLEFIAAEPVCKPSLWLELAYQIYSENGKDTPRELGHYPSGAPFLHGSDSRISITHTSGLLAVATLPRTPEANLIDFSERTALGIDAENINRPAWGSGSRPWPPSSSPGRGRCAAPSTSTSPPDK